jgi:hypothetical protein
MNKRVQLTTVKALLGINVCLLAPLFASVRAETVDEREFCKAATEIEETLAKKLPTPIDGATDVLSMRINCVTKTQSWQQVFKFTENELAEGWRERKQRQHTQLFCNREGFVRLSGWTVLTQLYDKDMMLMAEFVTTPDMCT